MAKQTKPVTRKPTTAQAMASEGKTNPPTEKKAAAQRAEPIAQAKAKPKTAKKITASDRADAGFLRRPDSNQPPSVQVVNAVTDDVLRLIGVIENYAANLRALDRKRHNAVGLRREGFIEAAFRLSSKFPQYFPHWLSTAKFKNDLDLFNAIRSLVEVCRSLEEKAWNINIEASDMVYTDALEYYSQVKDAAERRIDSAESIFHELRTFFESHGRKPGDGMAAEPTEKQIKRDVNALLHGRKDGEIVIKNVKPKLTGGTHEVIDETFKDRASFKETDEGEIN